MKPINAINCIDKYLFMGITLVSLALASCSPEPTPILTSEMPTHTPVSPTATGLTGPTQQPPASTATPVPECPSPTEGTQLMRNEEMGYCLLFPDGLNRLDSSPVDVCLVPEGPTMGCHNAAAFFDVSDATGRSASQAADDRIAQLGFDPGRSSLTIGGEEAVMLADVGEQASMREVLIVHDDRLYRLGFILPDPDNNTAVEQFERFYDTVINSLTFVPTITSSALAEVGQGSKGSAVIAFVKNGDVLLWDEADGQTQTIFDSGDAIRVELSSDGQLVAFVRRSFFAAGGFDQHQQSALWVVGRDGANPHEVVSAEQLRASLSAADTDSTNFPRLAWVPDTHRLLYSGNTYNAHGYGEGAHTPLRGVYQVDADTGDVVELAPPDSGPGFVASPDGEWVALVTPTGLSFFSSENHRLRRDVLTYPATGVPGKVTPMGVWTQDSTAFLIAAPIAAEGQFFWDFTLWRVPVDGEQALPLLTVANSSPNIVFAPDGSVAAVVHETARTPDQCARGQQPARLARSLALAGCPLLAETFLAPLPEDLGPLAVPRDTLDYSRLVWSPGGLAYVSDLQTRGDFYPLCPGAEQPIEVCGSPIHIPLQVEWLEWVDRTRFLYVTTLPRQLYLGSLAGSATLIAQDPASFDALASTCVDDSEFISDVTVPDGTHVAPGALFQKTWRIRNSGTCTWDDSYRLAFLSGHRMSGPRSTPLGSLDIIPEYRELFPTVRPGEEIEVSVKLIAPEQPGTYRGQWQMLAPDGVFFGTRPFVVIQVP